MARARGFLGVSRVFLGGFGGFRLRGFVSRGFQGVSSGLGGFWGGLVGLVGVGFGARRFLGIAFWSLGVDAA